MTIRLEQLQACFEGMIPAVIATTAADGTPNVSYLSHVAMVDAGHIALTNQFFGKTADNLRQFAHASVLVVDIQACRQYTMRVELAETLTAGYQFDVLAARVQASGARVGLDGVMRLRAVDVFRVIAIDAAPAEDVAAPRAPDGVPASLGGVQRVIERMVRQNDIDGLVEATLAGLDTELGMGHTLFMALEHASGMLSAIGSRGYAQSGIGSDVALGEGVIGAAALSNLPVRINDLDRTGRFSAAVAAAGGDDLSRRIALPGLVDPLSQIAVPISSQGALYGVLFAESTRRLAFSAEHEVALSIIARQAGAALALLDQLADDEGAARGTPAPASPAAPQIEVVHYQYDDSVFINGVYVIKGIAGRLLHRMLAQFLETGREEFSNREIRLDAQLRLPDVKDNLETRLLLLRRRLEERGFPIRLERQGRGLLRLCLDGVPRLSQGGEAASSAPGRDYG